jgi:hypothetical protein
MWSTTALDPALPGRSRNASGSPALDAVAGERTQRVEAEPALERPRRGVLIAVGASKGSDHVDHQRRCNLGVMVGAWSPASDHAGAQAVAQAVLIVASAAGALMATASTSRETVGSKVTDLRTFGAGHSSAGRPDNLRRSRG